MTGALCYAELATAYASVGGDYYFLQKAYGNSVSFLFAWARFSVIATGSIALLAFVFGDYLSLILPLDAVGPASSSALYAATIIVVLSWVNIRGIKSGASTQTWLTSIEVGGLILIVVAALYLMAGDGSGNTGTHPSRIAQGDGMPLAAFGMAMVFVLLTYGGWNEAAYIGAELKNARSNMVKSLVLSILIISMLYLLVTWAYWRGLGPQAMSTSDALAADLLRKAFGVSGEKIMALLVVISSVTSINATMITGARSSYAAGRDWPLLSHLGRWDAVRGTPANALRVQCIAALLLVAIGAWTGSGFKAMVEFTAPVFWLFFLLSGLSLFVLRRRDPDMVRPFRVPLFPLLPMVFCAMCIFMLWSSLSYVYNQSWGGLNAAWIGVAVLAGGAILLLAVRTTPAPASRPAITAEHRTRKNQ